MKLSDLTARLGLRRPTRPELICLALATLLLAQFVVRAELSLVQKSPIWDEQLHLRYGLDLLAYGPNSHGQDHPYPVTALFAAATRGGGDGPRVGRDLVVERSAHLWPARRMNLALATVGLGLLFLLAWRGIDLPHALAALCVGTLDPGWMAQARFVTTDIALGLAFGAAALVLLWLRHARQHAVLVALGLITGFGLAAKFSALLIPAFVTLACLIPRVGESLTQQLGRRVVQGLYSGAAVAVVALGAYLLVIEAFALVHGVGLSQGWAHVTDGMAQALSRRTAPRGVYLLGSFHEGPSLLYFPVLLAAKTPLSMWVLMAAAFATRQGRAFLSQHRLLWLTPGAFLLVAILSGVNLGHRHLTPVLPGLWLLAAAGGVALWRLPRRGKLYASGMALVLALECVLFHPHYLSATNAAFGGRGRAHWVAVDSASDWGQDLPALRDYLRRHPPQSGLVHLAYFGNARAESFIGPFVWRPCGQLGARLRQKQQGKGCFAPAEVLAISATCYVGATGRRVKGKWRLTEQSRCWKWLRSKKPDAILGGSILIFRNVSK